MADSAQVNAMFERTGGVDLRINSSLERLRALQSDCDRRIEELESEYESLVAGA